MILTVKQPLSGTDVQEQDVEQREKSFGIDGKTASRRRKRPRRRRKPASGQQ